MAVKAINNLARLDRIISTFFSHSSVQQLTKVLWQARYKINSKAVKYLIKYCYHY